MNPAEAAVAEDAEDVAFLRLTDDVFHDLIGGGDIIRLGVGGADVFHPPGRIESFFGGYLLDQWLGTAPLFSLIVLGLGVAAAIRNMLQAVAADDDT